MTSLTQPQDLSKSVELPDAVRTLVADNDLARNVAAQLARQDDETLAEANASALQALAAERQEYETRIAMPAMVNRIAEAILLARIIQRGARAIPSGEYVIELTASKIFERRIDVLRQLEAIVPADELKKALYLTQPEPQWTAHATQLKTLARKYGGQVADIVAEGLVESYGPPKLVFKSRESEKNVTPSEAAS